MARYRCSVCGYEYDEQQLGQDWSGLADDWTCPVCGAAKSEFQATSPSPAAAGEPASTGSSRFGQAVLAHRIFGYAFLAFYILLVVQMVPRLWTYQIEFPARTAVHIALGMGVGAALLLKLSIVRFFRKMEASLVPQLGTSILVASIVLIGISVPPALREAFARGGLFNEENRERVRTLLAQAGLDMAQCESFASTSSLRAGQKILRQDCIECHDLRTVLARPRTPANWRQTVRRMVDRTMFDDRLSEDEQWQVTAYLIALSPQLQKSTQQFREQQDRRQDSKEAAQAVATGPSHADAYEPKAAKALFESKCAQCHPLSLVSLAKPDSKEKAHELVQRMVNEGMEATEHELAQIIQYITETYARSAE